MRSIAYLMAGVSAVALACGGDSPTEPKPAVMDVDVRVSGPRLLMLYAQARTNATSESEDVLCESGDQWFDLVIRSLPLSPDGSL